MNKFKLLALALVVGTVSLFANNEINPDTSKDEIRNQIVELVADSEVIIDVEMVVNVTFTFSTEGEIVILDVDSKDEEILDFLRTSINSKKLKNPGKANRHYNMPISLK